LSTAAKLSWGLIIVAAILHTDLWAWENDTLVFGFVPMALAYHAGVSILAAFAWACVVKFDWPDGIEEWASAGDDDGGNGEGS
jgi:hypothetical protein